MDTIKLFGFEEILALNYQLSITFRILLEITELD